MNPQDQWLHQKEKILAWVRLGFSIAAIFVVTLNPERVARYPLLSEASLVTFVLYSLLVSIIVSRAAAAGGRANLSWFAFVTTCIYLLFLAYIFGLLSEFEQKQQHKLTALYKPAADAAAKEERSKIARELHDRLLQT